jgi:hypothetical protein
MTWKGKLARILQAFSFSAETVTKTQIVILQPVKNLGLLPSLSHLLTFSPYLKGEILQLTALE